jgi:dipeptide/tripeptide permease
MLQRVQSIWLLLAAVFAFLTFRLPFYTGSHASLPGLVDLNAQTTIWLTIVAALTGALAFITIFLFNNRKLQLRLCYFGILLTLGLLALCFYEMTKFTNGTMALSCIIYFAILAFYILAANGIRKDERLVRSMDRLR